MPLLLSEDDVRACLSMPEVIAALREAFADPGAQVLPRWRGRGEGALYSVMAAALPGLGLCGLKSYVVTRAGVRFAVLLNDMRSGETLAILQADVLGRYRTGAASGLATDLLAPVGVRTFACIGSGGQAETQVEAVLAVRPEISDVRIWSRTPEHAADFARRIGARAHACPSAREAVDGAEVVTTITNARQPVLEGAWLRPGCHVNAAGSNVDRHAELDAEAVARASLIYTDDVEGAKRECGDLVQAAVDWSRVHPLADLVAGRGPGREAATDISLFESQGIALEDVAAAALVYRRARERGVGSEVALP